MAENANLSRLLKFGVVAVAVAGVVWLFFRDKPAPEDAAIQKVVHLANKKDAPGLALAMRDANPEAASRAIEEFAKLRPDEISTQVAPLLQARNTAVRIAAATAYISASDPEQVAPLKNVLTQDTDTQVRGAAAMALGELHSYSGIDALIRGLDDPDVHVRQCSIEAIQKTLGVTYGKYRADSPREERAVIMGQIRADYPKFKAQIYQDNATGRLRRKKT
jgi:hypothetical protein